MAFLFGPICLPAKLVLLRIHFNWHLRMLVSISCRPFPAPTLMSKDFGGLAQLHANITERVAKVCARCTRVNIYLRWAKHHSESARLRGGGAPA